MMTYQKISEYIESNKNRWSKETSKKVGYLLYRWQDEITGDPIRLWNALIAPETSKKLGLNNDRTIGPYTRLLIFTNVGALWGYHHKGMNPYHEWKRTNANYFKNVYRPKKVTFTWEEVLSKIEAHNDSSFRRRAKEIILGALRYSESCQPRRDEQLIVGKGQKVRPDFRPEVEGFDYTRCYQTFRRQLKGTCGVSPHQLRKLALTRLVDKGATAADLCRVAGWSNIKTALYYLQAKRDEQLKEMLK